MIAAGIVPALVAILIGLPLLSRLKGDYFSFGTLGMGMIINVLFVKGGDLTGGRRWGLPRRQCVLNHADLLLGRPSWLPSWPRSWCIS